jgi:hypothetical protein
MKKYLFGLLMCSLCCYAQQTPSGPIVITGQSGTVISGLAIQSTTGDCVTITDSSNITIKNSTIGPCAGNGINISGGSSISVYDNYIHPEMTASTNTSCCDQHDGIYASGPSNLTVQGNVIAYGEANIEITNVKTANIVGNFLLNPIDSDPSISADSQSRGQNFQAWGGNSNVTVKNNYTLASQDTTKYLYPENQEDSINFGLSTTITVSGNYVRGGHSPSGCGVIADDTANSAQFLNNTLVDTGQCGLSIADGTNQVIDGNRVLNRTPVPGGGNVAIEIWKQYNAACGPVTVSNNTAVEVLSPGNYNSYWDGGGCGSVRRSNNTFDAAADSALEPIDSKYPAPAIPPQPFSCAAVSPYTNQTSVPRCSTATGAITGTVEDSSGTAISGATVSYSSVSTTTAGNGTYTFSNVPAGAVSVTAGATGYQSSTKTVRVNANATATQTFTLPATTGTSTPVITSASSATGTAGTAFSYQITATNNPTNFDASGLPAGLRVNTSSGLISGTPTAAGLFKIALSASNASGTGTGTLTFTVNSGGSPRPIAFIQGASSGNDSYATRVSAGFISATGSGDLIVVAVSWDTSGGAQPSVSDSQGNTYSLATTSNNAATYQGLAVYYATNIKGGADTVTVALNPSAGSRRLDIQEYSGIASTNPIDIASQNTGLNGSTGTDGVTSTSAITTVSGDLIFGVATQDSGSTGAISAGTGFTQRVALNNGADNPMLTEDIVQRAAGSVAATFTFSAPGSYQAQMVAFRAAGSTGSPSP